jgi:uncharacterized protein (DUF2141 family)
MKTKLLITIKSKNMKKLTLIIAVLLALGLQIKAQDSIEQSTTILEEASSELTVIVNGLKSDEGTMMIAVYTSEGNWLSRSQYRKSTTIVDGVATVVFENLPLGVYGISTYQDENNNGKLDTGLFGIPKEPYASSRGAVGRFGPPKWVDAQFKLSNQSHTEEINY